MLLYYSIIISVLLLVALGGLFYAFNRIAALEGHVSLATEVKEEMAKILTHQRTTLAATQNGISQAIGTMHAKVDQVHDRLDQVEDKVENTAKSTADAVSAKLKGIPSGAVMHGEASSKSS